MHPQPRLCAPRKSRVSGDKETKLEDFTSVLRAVDRVISGNPAAEGCSVLRPWTRAALLVVLLHPSHPHRTSLTCLTHDQHYHLALVP
ncbi:hypothetical protein E2C01_070815 [Portunus trituberculatus]|uniref:Uncharacterized protein n=1 Tax=Portunus trituberculatus TaxID=210409 RepID=A0A5B7I2N5_PORTR|nr:hypothetical protein [Portunus trituberculatus]